MESAGLEVGGKTQKAGRSHLRTHTATCNQQRSESHSAKVLSLGWEWGKKQKKELISGSVHLRSRLPPSAHPCGSRTPLVQMHKYPGNPPHPPHPGPTCARRPRLGARWAGWWKCTATPGLSGCSGGPQHPRGAGVTQAT